MENKKLMSYIVFICAFVFTVSIGVILAETTTILDAILSSSSVGLLIMFGAILSGYLYRSSNV